MPMTVQQIVAEAKRLSAGEQAELIELLCAEAVGGPDPALDEEWKQETRRRIVEIESGQVEGIPAEAVMAKARKIAGL
ncbi:MAG: addiction module protein [Opitutaceae bacterium]|nr:addiction module protein [Opitutaceae bacterium]MBP9913516.1 addiction module protein [Opitutaceae bacterium]